MDLAQLKRAHVLVTGDAMLDRYWFGDAERISPEAPVPVVRVTRTEERLGGAANVARNIATVGASSTLLSVVGNDEAGQSIEKLLRAEGIHPELELDPALKTTVKLRVVARQQQLVRCDFEAMQQKKRSSAISAHSRSCLPPIKHWCFRTTARAVYRIFPQ